MFGDLRTFDTEKLRGFVAIEFDAKIGDVTVGADQLAIDVDGAAQPDRSALISSARFSLATSTKKARPRLSETEPCCCIRIRSALRVTRHEAVVAELGDLEPRVIVVREVRQRFVDFLEVRVRTRNLAMQLLRRLEGSFHDLGWECVQLGTAREQAA